MTKRFQIEELIVQDESGVLFRALDLETGKAVGIRRFFPFGMAGGGFDDGEQAAYQAAVGRLAGLRHPAMRAVVCGGCDPVDGIPFIVTEWVDGVALESFIGQGIPAETAALLISQALEVCELLSQAFAEEAVWVETDPQGIIVCPAESGRGFTFWISPIKWLGGRMESRDLESIIVLTEQVMGWTGQVVNDQAGRGLGGWLKWLRNAATRTTLREARETLAAAVGAESTTRRRKLVETASRPPRRHFSIKTQRVAGIAAGLFALAGVTAWLLCAGNRPPDAHLAAEARPPRNSVASVNQRAAELRVRAAQSEQVLAAQESGAARRDGAIWWNDHELLVANKNQAVVIEGVVKETAASRSGKTVYLLFAGGAARDAARAGMRAGADSSAPMLEQFQSFIGKKVRVSGTVKLRGVAGLNRPDIIMTDISAVRIVE